MREYGLIKKGRVYDKKKLLKIDYEDNDDEMVKKRSFNNFLRKSKCIKMV